LFELKKQSYSPLGLHRFGVLSCLWSIMISRNLYLRKIQPYIGSVSRYKSIYLSQLINPLSKLLSRKVIVYFWFVNLLYMYIGIGMTRLTKSNVVENAAIVMALRPFVRFTSLFQYDWLEVPCPCERLCLSWLKCLVFNHEKWNIFYCIPDDLCLVYILHYRSVCF